MAPNTSESRVAVHHDCHRPFVWNPVRPGNEVGGEERASVITVEAQQRIKKVLLKLLVCRCRVGQNQERHNACLLFLFLFFFLWPRWEKRTQSSPATPASQRQTRSVISAFVLILFSSSSFRH
ncbi:hypothetical protein LY76DRAFT_15877 [Colletotrichum caudatum]|nr:hypothetical protein LY76DRAFT_15877 [Colletotrichum caudatum]